MNTKTILNAAALSLGLLGIFFKTQHWAGADLLLLLGLGLLLTSTLAFTAGENTAAGAPAVLTYATVAALTVGTLGIAFKAMHWQGGDLLVLLTVASMLVVSMLYITSQATVAGSRHLLAVTFVYLTLAFAVVTFLQKRPAVGTPVAVAEATTAGAD